MITPQPQVVGIVDSFDALEVAQKLKPKEINMLEWRADAVPELDLPAGLELPWILTVRDEREGGHAPQSLSARKSMFQRWMDHVDFVDIELQFLAELADVVGLARGRGVQIIGSYHNFDVTPELAILKEKITQGADANVDLVKIATFTQTSSDVRLLIEALEIAPLPISVMGMGPLGYASRLLLACSGSMLNYGYLHCPNIPGQWSAKQLRLAIDEGMAAGSPRFHPSKRKLTTEE